MMNLGTSKLATPEQATSKKMIACANEVEWRQAVHNTNWI
jgi:hypothetical protein